MRKQIGRPTKFQPRYVALAESMWGKGATNEEVAKKLKVSLTCLYEWLREYPQLVDAKSRAQVAVDDAVEAAMFKSATGYSHPEDHIHVGKDGQVTVVPTTKHYPPNPTSHIFWLKNRRPQKWRDRIDVNGPVDSKQLQVIDVEIMPETNALPAPSQPDNPK